MMTQQEWNAELERLRAFFNEANIPKNLRINNAVFVNNISYYITSNINRTLDGPGVWNEGPMLRLQELAVILNNKA